MASRVEELQKMVDHINDNGGLNSEYWRTTLLVNIAQNLAFIADVIMADRKTEPQPEIIRCEECMHNGSYDTDCPIDWNGKEHCSFAERSE